MDEVFELANTRTLNMTAVREHALKCSQEKRAGKFVRVSEDFLNAVQADVDSLLRRLNAECPLATGFEAVEPPEGAKFVTGVCLDKVQDSLNAAVARIIQRHVHKHPSVGKTLMG